MSWLKKLKCKFLKIHDPVNIYSAGNYTFGRCKYCGSRLKFNYYGHYWNVCEKAKEV